MAFRLYRSNRAEKLADALARVAARPLQQVFARECIVVQGPGMERWLSAVLANQLGIWANPWFPFPRAAVELILDAALGPAPESAEAFQPEALGFRIAATLPALAGNPAFVEVAHYLANDKHGERLLSVSRRLAGTFDQYLVYRPDLLLEWERGNGEHFQAVLWRKLTFGDAPPQHLARRMEALTQRGAQPLALAGLPERLSLFGISTLPPAFLHVLRTAARQLDVHMFVLSPAREYWGDLDRRQKHENDAQGLLADLGRSSRELLELLFDVEQPEEDEQDLFTTALPENLLGGLQADLVELAQRGRGAAFELPSRPLLESDDSLRVHACHSRTRELEVLRDELRDRFERDPSLAPGDVIVFAPEIEHYAPAIEAVFSPSGPEDPDYVPFRIADRRSQRASELSSTFLSLLDLLGSRLALSEVLDLLHRPLVRSRFEIDEADLDAAQRWLVEAGARWSIDAEHRKSFGQPAFYENSLRFAIDRLLLGFASADADQRAPYGVLPCHEVEGQDAELLGRVARYIESLSRLARDFAEPRSMMAWTDALTRALDDMLSDVADRSLEPQALRSMLRELSQRAQRAGFDAKVSLKAARTLLEERLASSRMSAGFLTGGITFCEHVPMRAIPFRVVCLLGVDDESFPRGTARNSFDLVAQAPRLGDRNGRDDDRQLFLEALLSARDSLWISYVGRSAQDDSVRPKSALVEHLLRVIDRHFVPTSDRQTLSLGFEGRASQLVSREHALHRFDPRYFRAQGKGPFFSYDQRALAAARAQLSPGREPAPFVSGPIAYTAQTEELSLDGLERFFRHPQRRFLKERLSVVLPREIDPIENREATRLDALERFRIGDSLLTQLGQLAPEERARVLTQGGQLPPGMIGKVQLEDIEALVEAVLSAEQVGPALPDRTLELSLGKLKLVGKLDRIHEGARVEHMVSTIGTKHKLSGWIRHLALCASGSLPNRTLLIGREQDSAQVIEFSPVDDARARLDELIGLYLLGMHMPLPYLHKPAQELMDKLAKGQDLASALAAASNKALPAARGSPPNDADDPHVRQVFGLRQLEQLGSLSASDGERELDFSAVAALLLESMQRHLSVRNR